MNSKELTTEFESLGNRLCYQTALSGLELHKALQRLNELPDLITESKAREDRAANLMQFRALRKLVVQANLQHKYKPKNAL